MANCLSGAVWGDLLDANVEFVEFTVVIQRTLLARVASSVSAPYTSHSKRLADPGCCASDSLKSQLAMMRPDAKVEKVYLYPKQPRHPLR